MPRTRIRLAKRFRLIAVAESFTLDAPKSVYAGVVSYRDGEIEDVAIALATVGGLDSTDAILGMLESLGRQDIQLILLDGCILSWYNIVDVDRLAEKLPVICLTFEEPRGNAESAIRKLFPADAEERLARLAKISNPIGLVVDGARMWIRAWGIDLRTAIRLVASLPRIGSVPYQIRVARRIARAVHRSLIRAEKARS